MAQIHVVTGEDIKIDNIEYKQNIMWWEREREKRDNIAKRECGWSRLKIRNCAECEEIEEVWRFGEKFVRMPKKGRRKGV